MKFKFNNYSRLVGQRDEYQWYQSKVFMDEPDEALNKVDSVQYQLPPSFPTPIHLIRDRNSRFAVEFSGWGEFVIFIVIYLKDGTVEHTEYKLDSTKPWPSHLLEHYLQNPFGLRGGVEPERFVVPERLIREITEDIVKKQSISIVGARMMGKTSLLKFIASEQCQTYYQDEKGQSVPMRFVYVDLQEHAGKSRNQLIPEIARTVSEGLPAKGQFKGSSHAEALEWIKQTTGRRRARSPFWILLFDEFDRVVELNGIDKTLFDELRSLPQHYNLRFVIASRRKLIDLPLPQGVSTSPFFNLFKEHFLSVWEEPTVRTLMFKPLGTALKLFTDDDFAFVSRVTAFHPLLLQMGCYHLFNARRGGEKRAVDYAQVQENYMQEAESVYRYYWNCEISDVEREWLRDCWQAASQRDTVALQALHDDTPNRKNQTIRVRLAKLGFVLNQAGAIEFPTGLQTFLGKL
ncbi:AAA family ATPase [Candidatus Poribacteria bacterium]|nr:AAA family ATPase [Candidatus Poribacteria bacterium]